MSQLKKAIDENTVLSALKSVIDEESGKDVVAAGMISSLIVKGNNVGFAIEIDIDKASMKEDLRKKCELAVAEIPAVDRVTAVLTSSTKPEVKGKKADSAKAIGKIIAVGSGKGGVGKSTSAVYLAAALRDLGFSVGIIDADIYGPSIPKMLGAKSRPSLDEDDKLVPVESSGIKSLSMGYLLDENTAAIWRGPMASKALNQLLKGASWQGIDYLIVDMPPGTGDIQLTLSKNYNLDGVILVTTPQEVAVMDVRKAGSMFEKVDVPIIGIIENMSYLETGESKNYIFGQGNAKKYAEESKIDFLGEVALDPLIAQNCDKGTIATAGEGKAEKVFSSIAQKITKKYGV